MTQDHKYWREEILLSYRTAIDFWIYQGQLNWNRFNVMLVANSILIAVIGSLVASEKPIPVLTMLLAVLDLCLSAAWAVLTLRGFDYHKYWGFWAWELEQ